MILGSVLFEWKQDYYNTLVPLTKYSIQAASVRSRTLRQIPARQGSTVRY